MLAATSDNRGTLQQLAEEIDEAFVDGQLALVQCHIDYRLIGPR